MSLVSSRSTFRSSSLLLPLLFSTGAAPSTETGDLADLLARARAANGIDAFQKSGRDVVLLGTITRFQVPGAWTLHLASDGRFMRRVDGDLPTGDGFDGHEAWHVDPNGMPGVLALGMREHLLLTESLLNGSWCLEDGPIRVNGFKENAATEGDATDVRTLRLRVRDGVLGIELDLDAATALPKEARWFSTGPRETWTFTDWRQPSAEKSGGLALPGAMRIEDGGVTTLLELSSVETAAPAPAGTFARPAAMPADTTFDPDVPSRLPGRRSRTGHLLVRAKLNAADDRPPGFFIFDSGAGSSAISPRVVDELELRRFGETQVGGGGAARRPGHFARGATLTIGPVTVRDLLWNEFDLGGLESSFGEKLDGIVGYDLLLRSVAVADMTTGAVDLFDPTTFGPASFARADVSWTPLILHSNHAHVRAAFDHDGEEEGIFRLDTGAPGVTILFHSPAVRTLNLLEKAGPPITGIAGIGGQLRARSGALDALKIGGRTFDHPGVILCEDETGAMADPWTTGTMGGGILGSFDVIFDYPHGRIGFVPHEKTEH